MDKGDRKSGRWKTLADRLRWGPPDQVHLDAASDTAMMARFAIYVATFGTTLGIFALIINPGPTEPVGVLVVAALAYLVAAILLVGFDGFPKWVYPGVALAGSVCISLEIYFSNPNADLSAFYLTVSIAVFFFFATRIAVLQVGMIAVMYAVVLALQDKPFGTAATSWSIIVGLLVLVGFLLNRVRMRIEWLVARLDDAARTDVLTGLLNRRGFEERFDHDLQHARRSGSELSLIVGDLDNFKEINDRFGHHMGDDALRSVGQALAIRRRRVDTVARLGGEEFAVVLPATNSEGAYMFAERLREDVTRATAEIGGGITISIGVATFPSDGHTSESLLRAADRAMYRAKALGRDRTVSFDEGFARGSAESVA